MTFGLFENDSIISLGVGNGAVYLSLHHVGIYCASIVLLWTVKDALILVVAIYMRCKLRIPWLDRKIQTPSGLSLKILLSYSHHINRHASLTLYVFQFFYDTISYSLCSRNLLQNDFIYMCYLVFMQDNWDPDWQSTSSSKVAYLIHSLKELQDANNEVQPPKDDGTDVKNIQGLLCQSWTRNSNINTHKDKFLVFSQFLEHIHVIEQQVIIIC